MSVCLSVCLSVCRKHQDLIVFGTGRRCWSWSDATCSLLLDARVYRLVNGVRYPSMTLTISNQESPQIQCTTYWSTKRAISTLWHSQSSLLNTCTNNLMYIPHAAVSESHQRSVITVSVQKMLSLLNQWIDNAEIFRRVAGIKRQAYTHILSTTRSPNLSLVVNTLNIFN